MKNNWKKTIALLTVFLALITGCKKKELVVDPTPVDTIVDTNPIDDEPVEVIENEQEVTRPETPSYRTIRDGYGNNININDYMQGKLFLVYNIDGTDWPSEYYFPELADNLKGILIPGSNSSILMFAYKNQIVDVIDFFTVSFYLKEYKGNEFYGIDGLDSNKIPYFPLESAIFRKGRHLQVRELTQGELNWLNQQYELGNNCINIEFDKSNLNTSPEDININFSSISPILIKSKKAL